MERTSDNKLEEITNLLWKIWWFSLYLLIISSIVFLISYLITSYFLQDYLFCLFFSILFFIFCQLFFYRFYDRYREEPYFEKYNNNLRSRLIVSFIFPLISLSVSIIPLLINSLVFKVQLLPIFYYSIINLNVFLYLYFKPIERFDSESKSFLNHILEKKPAQHPPHVKYCPKCGQLIEPDHYYCPNCGNNVLRNEFESKQEMGEINHRIYKGINLKKPHNFLPFVTYLSCLVYLSLTLGISIFSGFSLGLLYIFSFIYALYKTKEEIIYFPPIF